MAAFNRKAEQLSHERVAYLYIYMLQKITYLCYRLHIQLIKLSFTFFLHHI